MNGRFVNARRHDEGLGFGFVLWKREERSVNHEVMPEHASTVMVLRERGGSLEVYCVRRNPKLRAWGGAVAFPGGKLEAADFEPVYGRVGTAVHARVVDFGEGEAMGRASVVAGVRECFEEAGLVPVVGGCPQQRVEALRRKAADCGFGEAIRQEGLTLDLGALVPVARWVTPRGQIVRFDARFYAMALPLGQVGSHDEIENLEGRWISSAEMLERFEQGKVQLVPPTQWMLNMLSKFKRIDDVCSFAGRQDLQPIRPELSTIGPEVRLVLPGHPAHSQALRSLEGPTSFVLQNGRYALTTKT